MARFQLSAVGSIYGAPMGRRESSERPTEPRTVSIQRVRINAGGYDAGGAYWGTGAPLYVAWADNGYRQFVRAASRDEAADALRLPDWLLILGRSADGLRRAYSINPLLAATAKPGRLARILGSL